MISSFHHQFSLISGCVFTKEDILELGYKAYRKYREDRGSWASQVAQWVKNLPVLQETQEMWVQSLSQEEPLEEEMATYSSIIACGIPWTEEEPGRIQGLGHKESDTTEWLSEHACMEGPWIKTLLLFNIFCLGYLIIPFGN